MDLITQRLENEYRQVEEAIDNDNLKNIYVEVEIKNNSKNFYKWNVTIYGRQGTPWEGGEFPGVLDFSQSRQQQKYPQIPPVYNWKMYGNQRFLHMNIYKSGNTCLDILNDEQAYRPALSCLEILIALENFLYNPNPKSPTDGDLARLFMTNKKQYEQDIQKFVQKFMKAKEEEENK